LEVQIQAVLATRVSADYVGDEAQIKQLLRKSKIAVQRRKEVV
jgi:hypothetical protein